MRCPTSAQIAFGGSKVGHAVGGEAVEVPCPRRIFSKISQRHGVGVIPAGAGGGGRELVAALAVRRYEGGAFFLGTIDIAGMSRPWKWTSSGGVCFW